MKKQRTRLGFTMLEMLIVVAVVAILSGVAFVGVQNYQRNMTRLEMDSVAKEIFVAAQNHLTMAKTQNYLGLDPKENATEFGTHGQYPAPARDSDGMAYFDGFFEGELTDQVDNGVYYIIKNQENREESMPQMWGMMLPWGAVDESSRQGNYIIRYQPGSGRVLDVFYCNRSGRYAGSLAAADYDALMDLRDAVDNPGQLSGSRMRYGDMVVGWYGGAEAVAIRKAEIPMLNPPEIEVFNGDKLVVRVTDRNTFPTDPSDKTFDDYKLQLIVTGLEVNKQENTDNAKIPRMAINLCVGTTRSGQEVTPLGSVATVNRIVYTLPSDSSNPYTTYEITLDDITTQNMRFASITPDSSDIIGNSVNFASGQNIRVQAQAFHTAQLGNIASSDMEITNSLFADLGQIETVTGSGTTEMKNTAFIRSFRHLENLDALVSGLDTTKTASTFTRAVQTTDLKWNKFMTDHLIEGAKPSVYTYKTPEGERTEPGGYYPINPTYALEYDGQSQNERIQTVAAGGTTSLESQSLTVNHSISDVKVIKPDTGRSPITDAGLFGAITKDSTSVKNLELIDFDIKEMTDNAGALAGRVTLPTGTTGKIKIENVLARNTGSDRTATISAAGDVGGLIGAASGCDVEKCAAALVVVSTGGNAGGLIGSTTGGSVTACYSGGHTTDAKYEDDAAKFNVTATAGAAGGLIGVAGTKTIAAGTTNIASSYSTCSAYGKQAGGFVGTSAGDLTDCYATGLVWGPETTDTVTVNTTIKGKPAEFTLPNVGAFANSTDGTLTRCKYYEIINERYLVSTGTSAVPKYKLVSTLGTTAGKPDKGEFFYLAPLGGNENPGEIAQLDADATAYNTFVGADSGWKDAWVYDSTLIDYYGAGTTDKTARFNLETVAKLGATTVITEDAKDSEGKVTALKDFVATHYGDWPTPEIFVFNTAS